MLPKCFCKLCAAKLLKGYKKTIFWTKAENSLLLLMATPTPVHPALLTVRRGVHRRHLRTSW